MSKNWLASKAMLASLTISQWSARRLDRDITDEVNESHGASADAGRYNKLLVAKSAIDPIQKVVNEARLAHLEMTQPWADIGPRLLPAALYMKYTERMSALRTAFEREVDLFARDYPSHVEARRVALNGLFKEKDYPADVRKLFCFDVAILPCPDASDFRVELAAEHADDIRRDIERRMQEAMDTAMQEPIRRIVESVGRMAARLRAYKPAAGGNKAEGVFRDTLVENVRELAELLPAFNLKGDPKLDALTRRMNDELCVEDAKALRENDHARASVAASADAILAEAQALLA